MADHSKPVLTDNYTNVLDQVRGRFEDQAKGFDPANTTATNIPANSIRWTSASNKWQKWNGTSWVDLSSLYAINISGNAGTVTNGVYTTGNQTIGGTKTFSSLVQGSVSGNSGTVTNGVYTVGNQTIVGVKTFSDNTIVNGNLGVGTSSPVVKLDVQGAIHSFGNSDVPSTVGTNAFYTGGYASPDSGRIIFGDGTGWKFHFSKKSSGVTADLITIQDNGKLILSTANQGIQFADSTTQTTAASSGSYIPTVSDLSNSVSSVSDISALFTKVGGVVTISFSADVVVSSANYCAFIITLPSGYLSVARNGAGSVGGLHNGTTSGSFITGNVLVIDSTRALIQFMPSPTGTYRLCTSFSYATT
jgi:hypothetical protein